MDGSTAFIFWVSVCLFAVTVNSLHDQDHATLHPAYAKPMPQNSSCPKNGEYYPELIDSTPHDLVFPRQSGLHLAVRCPPFWYFVFWWSGSTEGNVLMASAPKDPYLVDPNIPLENDVLYSYLFFPEITRSGNFTCCNRDECHCVHQITFVDSALTDPSESTEASSSRSTNPTQSEAITDSHTNPPNSDISQPPSTLPPSTLPPSTSTSVPATKLPGWLIGIIVVISLALLCFFLKYFLKWLVPRCRQTSGGNYGLASQTEEGHTPVRVQMTALLDTA